MGHIIASQGVIAGVMLIQSAFLNANKLYVRAKVLMVEVFFFYWFLFLFLTNA